MVIVKDRVAEFRFFRPEARQVRIVGDFTGWRCNQIPMTLAKGGYWKAKVSLSAGLYRFRYLADGQWYTDYAAFGVEYGPFGVDSVLRVVPEEMDGSEEEPVLERAVDARLGLPGPQALRVRTAEPANSIA